MTAKRLKLPEWATPVNPVYRLETTRWNRSRGLLLLQRGCLPAILAAGGALALAMVMLIFLPQVYWSVEGAFAALLAVLMFLLAVMQAMSGAVVNILMVARAAPMISEEVELQSWGLLRTTTLTLREIVMAKFAAALRQLRSALIGLMGLRVTSTITGLLGIGFILRSIVYNDLQGFREAMDHGLWLLPVAALGVFVVWYLAQPFVQFLLNASLGMLASASMHSRARAVAVGLGARLAGWVLSITLNAAALYGLGFIIIANWTSPYSAPIEYFQNRPEPKPETVIAVVCAVGIAYVLGVLATQLGLTALCLGLAQRRARHVKD
jgi:hypothetical protein